MYLQSGMPLLLHFPARHLTKAVAPIISRAFGYMGLALYESVVPGIPANTNLFRAS